MKTTREILTETKAALPLLTASRERKNAALLAIADRLVAEQEEILAANRLDIEGAKDRYGDVMMDRLTLTPERIAAMAQGVREVAELPDPEGRVLRRVVRPNGLVTSDAAVLALKSGNAVVLRGGREAYRSNAAIVAAIHHGLEGAGLPSALVGFIEDTSHASADELMQAVGYVDLLIPRGGAGLIRRCTENAKVPCIQTGTGICHIFVDETADQDKALSIIENAKASRPSVCNAEEVLLVHRNIAAEFLPKLCTRLTKEREDKGLVPVELRLDHAAAAIIPGKPAGERDFDTEFLDYILAVAVVDDVDTAIRHIALHSTGHSESIITESDESAEKFTRLVDASSVYVNASTRFTDGGEFGLGCEMGISTQKLHARGPMGLEELNSYKYIIRGNGQIR